jgi:hypothetical protein
MRSSDLKVGAIYQPWWTADAFKTRFSEPNPTSARLFSTSQMMRLALSITYSQQTSEV